MPKSTLDRWVDRLGIDRNNLRSIRVNTQGWEPHVLPGRAEGGELLGCPHITWHVEVDPRQLRAAGGLPTEFFRTLRNHFTHFLDLDDELDGPRARTTYELWRHSPT